MSKKQLPNFNEEKRLWAKGFDFVAGIDEAGRGPLAGPVVAAAVLIDKNAKINLDGINDSKKLTESQREKFFEILTNNENIKWGAGIVPEKIIDRINILEATKLAMLGALEDLNCDFLLVDGNAKIYCATPQKTIVAGDSKVVSISAAGIIAKVTRDRIMQKYHKKYPDYNFDQNKGYGTKAHFAAIKKFGPCPIHRKSFYPINLI